MYLKWNSWSHYKDPKCLKASIHQPWFINAVDMKNVHELSFSELDKHTIEF